MEASSGNMKHLDTVNFKPTMSAYANYVKRFEDIVNGVNRAAGTAVEHWKGKGRDAFEKDYKQVQLNLKDVSDIMYDLRDALINAEAEYIKTDLALSKSYES